MPLNLLVAALYKSDHFPGRCDVKGMLCSLSRALSPGNGFAPAPGPAQGAGSPRSPGSWRAHSVAGRAEPRSPSASPQVRVSAGPQPDRGSAGLLCGSCPRGCRAEPAGQTRVLNACLRLSDCSSKLSAPPHVGPSVHVFVLSAS